MQTRFYILLSDVMHLSASIKKWLVGSYCYQFPDKISYLHARNTKNTLRHEADNALTV